MGRVGRHTLDHVHRVIVIHGCYALSAPTGTPLLSLVTDSFPGRVAGSFLNQGLHGQVLATNTWKSYIDVGVKLCTHPGLLMLLRRHLLYDA